MRGLKKRGEAVSKKSRPRAGRLRPPETGAQKSIAVLPFKNMSADPDNEYFSEGLSESIINTLARIRNFKVVARTSAFSFKGQDVDIREIGRRLNVDHILEGGVQKTARRLRITTQLIDVADGCHLWSERFDRPMADIFAIQDEISLAIVNRLKTSSVAMDRKQIVKRHTEDPEAYNLYLKGRYFYNKRTEDDLKRSIQSYQAAIARDPGFALPHAGLADSYMTLGFYHWLPTAEARDKAEESALKGLEIDDGIGETHAACANVVLWFDWQWARAEEEFKKAIQLSPSDVEARHMYAHLMESEGRLDEALAEMGRALELEPLSVNLNTCLAQILFFARRNDEAIERLRKTIEMDPGFPLQYFWLGRAYLQKEMLEEAIETFEKGTRYPAINAIALCGLGHAYAAAGRKDEAQQILDQLGSLSKEKHIDYYYIAFLHAGMNRREKALDCLEKARDEGDMYLFSLKVDPAFDGLHDEPRFRELLIKTGLASFPKGEATVTRASFPRPQAKPESLAGRTIAHYRLIGKIGEGGMGVVYKAEDTKLRRTVALKFLPPEMTRDTAAAARFLREAQTAAALDHSNICTIFEINDKEGHMFISMAYVEGQSLKDRIAQGPLEIEEVLDIARQVAEGLRAAHSRGVIHRDIKPGNIMLTPGGQAKIMDFGLAKFDRGADVTRTMAVMGTVAYMSPEQARGDPVDQRTDVWSFGVTLYEMLTGKPPFGKRPEQPLIYAILNEEPEPIREARPDIPRAVELVVLKALEKEPSRRYQGMDDVLRDLRAVASSAVLIPEPKKSIIVLPFDNMSPEPEQEYFCDGMTEEIITDLSRIHDLLVISRNSAMTFKGTKKKTREIAREANVRYVLEGSVRKAGNNLRITAQLIDAETEAHVWAEKYSGPMDDVFDIQEKVSRAIADALKIQLTPEEKHELRERPIRDVRAYECYLRARQEHLHYTEDSQERAISLIQDGLKTVGESVLLHSLLGLIYFNYVNHGLRLEGSYLDKAEECVKRIFELEPASARGFYLLGLISYKRGDVQAAVKNLKKALALESGNADAIDFLVYMYADVGRPELSEPLVKRLLEIDPFTPHNHWVAGWTRVMQGRIEEGLPHCRKAFEMDPENPIWRMLLAHQLYMNRRSNEGDAIADLMVKETPDLMVTSLTLVMKHALRGEREAALSHLTDEVRRFGEWDELISWILAQGHAAIGDKDEALSWLEHAVDRGFINYRFLNEIDPFLANIRSEPRFKKLMERVKREWENFEV